MDRTFKNVSFYLQKRLMLTTFLFYIIFFSSVSPSFSAQKSDGASECAATFFIMTSIGVDIPKLGTHFSKLGQLASAATSIHMTSETGAKVSRGSESRKKSAQIRRVGELRDPQVVSILESCMGWIEALKKKMKKGERSKLDFKKVILHGPSPSKTYSYPYPDNSWVAGTVKKSLRHWKLNGRITPDDLRDLLKK